MKKATYVYRVVSGPTWDRITTTYRLRVEILEELKGERSRVKFLEYHNDKRGPGTVTTVYNKSLVFPKPATPIPAPGPRPDHYRDPYND